MFVQNHQIDRQLLHPPVFVGAEQLADDLQILDVGDSDQNDRQVAGNPDAPRAPPAHPHFVRAPSDEGRSVGLE